MLSLKEWRRKKAISPMELHRASGVSRATIYAIESGKSRGSVAVYRKLAAALGISPEDIQEYNALWRRQHAG